MPELTEGQKAEIKMMLRRKEWSTPIPNGNGGFDLIPRYEDMSRKLGIYPDFDAIRDYKNSLYEKIYLDNNENVQFVERGNSF